METISYYFFGVIFEINKQFNFEILKVNLDSISTTFDRLGIAFVDYKSNPWISNPKFLSLGCVSLLISDWVNNPIPFLSIFGQFKT